MQILPGNGGGPAGAIYAEAYPDTDYATRIRNRRRIRLFLAVTGLCLLVSLSYTFLRPAIYESRASLLITTPVIDERAGDVSNAQHVELELQYLTGHAMLTGVLERLAASAPSVVDTSDLTPTDLEEMLAAVSVDNTNLIELVARGHDKERLPVVLDAWFDVYQDARTRAVTAESESASAEIGQQLVELEQKVAEKRQALDQFRKDSDIVSMERNENRILRKLSGLTESLNKATEEKVTAQARLGAIRAAVAAGRPVAGGNDSLTNLEDRLVDIQEQLKELENEFTPRYMSVDPVIKGLVRKRDLLEQEIRNKRRQGRQGALAQAEQDVASARQAVASLQRQLDEHKQQVMEFTTRFAEHEALQEELLALETAYRDAQDRQLQLQVNVRRQYPQINLKERAFLPESPSYPHYLRDAGISVAGSLLFGLLALFLYDFLNRPARQSGLPDIKPVFVTAEGTRLLNQAGDERLLAVNNAAAPALTHQLSRELAESEVQALLEAADPDARLLIACLLSGLEINEAQDLRWGDIDTGAGELHVDGKNRRVIPVTAPLAALVSECAASDVQADAAVWQDASGGPLGAADLAALVSCAAHDAGLTTPTEVTPEALRHTHLAYLVRQGIRLGDLAKLAGYISPTVLATYGVMSPPGAAVALDPDRFVYPALGSYSPAHQAH